MDTFSVWPDVIVGSVRNDVMLYLFEILGQLHCYSEMVPGLERILVPAIMTRYGFLCLEVVPECELIDVYLCFFRFLFVDS